MRAVAVLLMLALSGCGAMYASGEEPSAWQQFTAAPDLDGAVVGASPGQATIAMVFASWCGHCRREVGELEELLSRRQDVRVIGVNFRHHEEYDQRGDSEAVRAFVRDEAPWMRVVPGDRALWRSLGAPTFVPTVYVFDRAGALVASYDRKDRDPPDADELDALLSRIQP